jgi:hypothetical protein
LSSDFSSAGCEAAAIEVMAAPNAATVGRQWPAATRLRVQVSRRANDEATHAGRGIGWLGFCMAKAFRR